MAEAQKVAGVQDIIQQLVEWAKGKNWLQIIGLIKQIIAALTGPAAGTRAAATVYAGCPFGDCCKEHHDAVNALSDCWLACCQSHPDCQPK